METPVKRKWVRGKALETVLGLGALQLGDELLVSYVVGRDERYKRARKSRVVDRRVSGPLIATCPCMSRCKVTFRVSDLGIVAWRRPTVDK
jgi:hypothetical protein